MHAAIQALNQLKPIKTIIASPVASPQVIAKMELIVDDIICLVKPSSLGAVGFWYNNFSQVSDHQVCNLLCKANESVIK